jgi:hypothetical protein
MAYQYIRNMTRHMLTPLRSKRDPAHLVLNAVPDATQAAFFRDQAVPAGRCMHLVKNTGSGELPNAKLGCTGNAKVPVWIYRASDSYSAGYAGPEPSVANGPGWATGMRGAILMYVGFDGFELSTTEYDQDQNYTVGDYLRAPEADANAVDMEAEVRNVAGVVTKALAVYGSTTIVGQVSPGYVGDSPRGVGFDPFGNKVLTFYTRYVPPVAGLVTGTPTSGTAGL